MTTHETIGYQNNEHTLFYSGAVKFLMVFNLLVGLVFLFYAIEVFPSDFESGYRFSRYEIYDFKFTIIKLWHLSLLYFTNTYFLNKLRHRDTLGYFGLLGSSIWATTILLKLKALIWYEILAYENIFYIDYRNVTELTLASLTLGIACLSVVTALVVYKKNELAFSLVDYKSIKAKTLIRFGLVLLAGWIVVAIITSVSAGQSMSGFPRGRTPFSSSRAMILILSETAIITGFLGVIILSLGLFQKFFRKRRQ